MKGRKTGGRVKGVPNRLTQSAREAFQLAFRATGGAQGLATWAADNRTEFYKLFARLIPIEVAGEGGGPVRVVFGGRYQQDGQPKP